MGIQPIVLKLTLLTSYFGPVIRFRLLSRFFKSPREQIGGPYGGADAYCDSTDTV